MTSSSNEQKIKLLECQRQLYFERIQQIYDNSRKDLNNPEALEDFLCSVETLDEIRSNFQQCVKDINLIFLKMDKDSVPDFNKWLAFEDLYCRIKRKHTQFVPKSTITIKHNDNSSQGVKLARIEIPEFDGNAKDWPLFYATFQNAVHLNPSLSVTEKMFYLASKLKDKAKNIYAGFVPSAENYETIYSALVSKFEDKRNLAGTYLNQMFSLKPIASATADNLENLIDQFSNSYLALNNLKLTDLCDFVMSHALLNRLDKETARLFEMENRGKEIPTLEDLISFVRDRIKVLNRTGDNTNNVSISTKFKPQNTTSRNSPRSFVVNNNACPLCKDSSHERLYSCPKFKALNPRERYDYVKKLRACINCLSLQHNTNACKSENRCFHCKKSHHSTLCFQTDNRSPVVGSMIASANLHGRIDNKGNSPGSTDRQTIASSSSVSNKPVDNVTSFCSMSANSKSPRKTHNVLLGTVLADVKRSDGTVGQVRILIDNGSQNHFISRRACKKLGIRIFHDSTERSVNGIGSSSQSIIGMADITLMSRYDTTFSLKIRPLVLKTIASDLPSCEFDISPLSYIGDLQLADPNFNKPAEIDILLGAEIFMEILRPEKLLGPPGKPDLLETAFGYLLLGSIASLPCHNNSACNDNDHAFFSSGDDSIETLVSKFWELESVPTQTHMSKSEKECEDFYALNTHRDNTTGRYVTALPFSQPTSMLGDSLTTASRCLSSLERRFQTNTALKQEYDNVMRDYLERNIISPASALTDKDYYVIPHHGVCRMDKPLRVVLNASAKCIDTNVSLNDCLHSGPNLQADLTAIILKFRLFPIALTADIKQMFLAIGIREEDRRFLNILYKFDEDDTAKLYNFNRVCFGLRCSPYLAMKTVKQLAHDETDLPIASDIASNHLYMDDLGVSVATAEEGVQLSQNLIELFKRGGFDLVKFVSNSPEVLKAIPTENRLSSKIEFDKEDNLKLLGLIWSPIEDEFSISIKFNPQSKCTKRLMLSTIAKLWDINGFCAPVILHAKLLIKALWTANIDWDAEPPRYICVAWKRFLTELPALQDFKIPRFLGIVPNSRVIMLGFADASEKALGASVYVCIQPASGPNEVNLIGAKSKVAPLKVVSLARLELCALVLLSKLFRFIIDTVSSRCHIDEIFAFSDSTVALHWVHSSPHRFDTFVANRIAQIQDNLSAKHFYHCESSQNPSDCLSRGLTPAQLLDHPLWLHGPTWARDEVHTWPINRFTFDPAQDEKLLEIKKHSNVFITTEDEEPLLCTLAKRVSSWSKFLRIVVYMYRFLGKLPRSDRMQLDHLQYAEIAVIKALQQQYFRNDINALAKNHRVSKSLLPLSPFLDNNILRVGGRLEKSSLEFDSKHPILLPKKDHIVNLIIDYYHRKYLHAGPQLLLSMLRQKFWIISGRSTVKQRFRLCNSCFKANPRTEAPFMATLPAARVNEAKAFLWTGVDYAGPQEILISRYRGARKVPCYFSLFTCMVTRSVHVEISTDLSTASFLRAFRRFISRRGKILSLFSDNGTNFVGAKAKLDELNKFLKSKAFQDAFTQETLYQGINWVFNAPTASHMGGAWESMIRVFKSHLRRTIGDVLLTYEELLTVATQVEAILNSRPLTVLSSDPAEPEALTPAHFLTLGPLDSFHSDPRIDSVDLVRNKRLIDGIVQRFWNRWRREYLNTLQTRAKWNTKSYPVTKGTVVLLKSENSRPLQWPIGIIDEVKPSSDGIIRIVSVRTRNGTYVRPVVKLCVLPSQ